MWGMEFRNLVARAERVLCAHCAACFGWTLQVDSKAKIAYLSEHLCIGCGICVKKCPFDAIMIINLPGNLESQTVHRYSANSFKLHRLPMPRAGSVLGLVGTNGRLIPRAADIPRRVSGGLPPVHARADSASWCCAAFPAPAKGIGKSTALKILAGKEKPNLGRFDDAPDWHEILMVGHSPRQHRPRPRSWALWWPAALVDSVK